MKPTLFIVAFALVLLLSACDSAPSQTRSGAAQTPPGSAPQPMQYTCPMHPHYISTDPNGSCPICGMALVPVGGDAGASASDGSVAVAPEMIQTMGVRIEPVLVADFGRSLRAFGTVESNERLENVSVSRIEGWIEDLRVRAEGDSVRPGELLYRVYSPDLISAQKDYLNSLAIGNDKRIAAVHQRLRSLGMQIEAINRLTGTRTLMERVPVYAETGGTVAVLQVREGDYVKPGTPVLRLQSYADVWIIARIPEQDLALIATGLRVRLDFPSAPGGPAVGRINYVYPTIDPKTRTGEVRIEVDNASGLLRPGAYADISLDLGGQARLSVPTEALLRDSRGNHVIVALGNGRFAGRTVKTGISANGRTEILTGLTAGEQIVASGQFMLDSEINLREGFSKLEAPLAGTAGPDTPLAELSVNATTLAEIDHFTDMALYFHEALTEKYKVDPTFLDPALRLGDSLRLRFAGTRLAPIVDDAQAALQAAKEAREGEPLGAQLDRLMAALEPWLLQGAPGHYRNAGLTLFRDSGSGRLWLQDDATARNPYRDSPAVIVLWPDLMSVEQRQPTERRPVDPHAGHR